MLWVRTKQFFKGKKTGTTQEQQFLIGGEGLDGI